MTDPNEENRKKVVEKHLDNLNEAKKNISKSREEIAEDIRQNKLIYNSLDKIESEVNKGIKVASMLLGSDLSRLPGNSWESYQAIVRRNSSFCATADSFYQDTGIIAGEKGQLTIAVKVMEASISGTTATSYYFLKNDPQVGKQVTLLEDTDTVDDDANYIKGEFNSLCPDKESIFDKIILDWKTVDPEIKYTALLDLRSLIFYQILESFCEESRFSKSPWYSRGLKKRFCQAKYFMIGNTNESSLIQTTKLQVNSTANGMQDHFDKLSEYGKHGKDQATTDSLFVAVLSDLVQCLQLRTKYYRP